MRKFLAEILFIHLFRFRRSLLEDEPELITELLRIQQEILGKPELITPDRPVKASGQFVGGTEWERYDGLTGVKGSRCHTLGPSNQSSRRLVSPTAAAKVMNFELDSHQKLRRDIIKVRSMLPDLAYVH